MTDEGKTTIVFSGGAEIRVTEPVDEVEAKLIKVRGVSNEQRESTGFAAFNTSDGATVRVAADQVAFVLGQVNG
jgi:hypothetical protein